MQSKIVKFPDVNKIDISKYIQIDPDYIKSLQKELILDSTAYDNGIEDVDKAIRNVLSYEIGRKAKTEFLDELAEQSEFDIQKQDIVDRINLISVNMKRSFEESEYNKMLLSQEYRVWINMRAHKDVVFQLLIRKLAQVFNIKYSKDEVLGMYASSPFFSLKHVEQPLKDEIRTYLLSEPVLVKVAELVKEKYEK